MPRFRRALHAEDGFTLIEMVVAMTVAALVLMGGAAVLGGSMKAIIAARANSQSAELISEQLEKLRAIDYAAVAMTLADLTGDTAIGGTVSAPTFDPDGTGSLPAESIIVATGGVVTPHVTTVTRNSQSYTLSTYVTKPPTDTAVSTAAYKRVTVRATWTRGGRTHTRQSSTFMTRTRRGLPLPNFQVTATAGVTSPITVNAGAQLVLPFNVVNRGARDTFNLSLSGVPSLGATFAYYYDTGGSKTYESSGTDADVAAHDADVNGVSDTDEMETDKTLPMLAIATVPSSATAGSYIFTLTGTSSGQPTATGATRTAQFDVRIVNDSQCSGCTYTALYLRNEYPSCASAPCNTTALTGMPLNSNAPTAATLPNFDTDVDSGPGRAVARAGSTPAYTSTVSTTMANWRYSVPSSTTLNGDVIVDVYVAATGSGTTPGTGVPVTLTAYVGKSTNGSGATSLVNSASATLPAQTTADFVKVRIRVPVNTTVANNRFLEVKVVVDSASSTTGAWLAYDAFAYPSVVWIPVV